MRLKISLVIITTFFHVGVINAQYSLEECKEYYLSGEFSAIIPSLDSFSGPIYNQNSFLINYMLGTSLCRTDNADAGIDVLEWLIKKYDLDYKQIRKIRNEINTCGGSDYRPGTITRIEYGRVSTTGVSSKVYKPTFRIDSNFAFVKTGLIDSSYYDIYPKRIIKKDSAISIDIPEQFDFNSNKLNKYFVSDNFILFAGKNKTDVALEKIAERLESVLTFYHRYFHLEIPVNYINVYVLGSFKQIEDFAEEFHNIWVRDKTIGYAFQPDYSITGYLPFSGIGTLCHELYHLLLHHNFQAVPPWMDEGLSSLYEASGFNESGILLGRDNWRGKIIADHWEIIEWEPYVKLSTILTEFDWQEANDEREYFELVYAISRYFFLYLQEHNKLNEYVISVLGYSPKNEDDYFILQLENVFNDDYGAIEINFLSWLEETVK